MLITVSVPPWPNRATPGRLSVDDFECACLCKSDNSAAMLAGNPSRDPRQKDCDTPTGWYLARVGAVETPEHSYGPYPVVHLIPTSGDAMDRAAAEHLKPMQLGLAVHGGPPNDAGQLRPTHGCARVADVDQAELVRRLNLNCGRAFLEVVEG